MRAIPLLVYVGLAVALFARNGIPLAGDRLIAWLVGALLCISIAIGSNRWRTLLRDWLPLAVALTAYNMLTGIGGGRVPIHSEPPIWVGEHLFGTVPSVWLQQHLWNPAHISWYDYASFAVYMSFFLATPVVLAVLWLQRPEGFRRYLRLLIGLWACALVFFTLTPTMPPWLASAKGMIGPVTRIVAPIGLHVPIFDPAVLWERGVRLANDLAAFPSLHEAMTLLIAVFFWPTARRPVRVLLALYPLAMAFTLVYTGEHYLTDIVGGVLLTVFVVTVEARVAEVRSARGAARADREHRGRARALGADDQPAVRAGLAHDRVRP